MAIHSYLKRQNKSKQFRKMLNKACGVRIRQMSLQLNQIKPSIFKSDPINLESKYAFIKFSAKLLPSFLLQSR